MIKKSKSVTVRFTDDDYRYLKVVAKLAGQNISGYIRMLANMSITVLKIKLQKGEISDADFQTLLND